MMAEFPKLERVKYTKSLQLFIAPEMELEIQQAGFDRHRNKSQFVRDAIQAALDAHDWPNGKPWKEDA